MRPVSPAHRLRRCELLRGLDLLRRRGLPFLRRRSRIARCGTHIERLIPEVLQPRPRRDQVTHDDIFFQTEKIVKFPFDGRVGHFQQQARTQAVQDAMAKAKTLADAAGVKLSRCDTE